MFRSFLFCSKWLLFLHLILILILCLSYWTPLLFHFTRIILHCHSIFWSLFFGLFFFSSQSLPVAVLESVFCVPLFKSLMTMLNKTRASRHIPAGSPGVTGRSWYFVYECIIPASSHLSDNNNIIKHCSNTIKYQKLHCAAVSRICKSGKLHTGHPLGILWFLGVLWGVL